MQQIPRWVDIALVDRIPYLRRHTLTNSPLYVKVEYRVESPVPQDISGVDARTDLQPLDKSAGEDGAAPLKDAASRFTAGGRLRRQVE